MTNELNMNKATRKFKSKGLLYHSALLNFIIYSNFPERAFDYKVPQNMFSINFLLVQTKTVFKYKINDIPISFYDAKIKTSSKAVKYFLKSAPRIQMIEPISPVTAANLFSQFLQIGYVTYHKTYV